MYDNRNLDATLNAVISYGDFVNGLRVLDEILGQALQEQKIGHLYLCDRQKLMKLRLILGAIEAEWGIEEEEPSSNVRWEKPVSDSASDKKYEYGDWN